MTADINNIKINIIKSAGGGGAVGAGGATTGAGVLNNVSLYDELAGNNTTLIMYVEVKEFIKKVIELSDLNQSHAQTIASLGIDISGIDFTKTRNALKGRDVMKLITILSKIKDWYITIHLNNVDQRAIDYYVAGDYLNLYDTRSYNNNISCYNDVHVHCGVQSTFDFSVLPNNFNTMTDEEKDNYYNDALDLPYTNITYEGPEKEYCYKCKCLYIYMQELARRFIIDLIDIGDQFFTHNQNAVLSKQEQVTFCSKIAYMLEAIADNYVFYSLLDYTRETESYALLKIILPTYTGNDSKEFVFGNNDNLCSFRYGSTIVNESFHEVMFDTISPNRELFLFLRFARHFDKIGNTPPTKTSYLFDNTNIIFKDTLPNHFVMEIYYDSYYGLLRDYKSYPTLVFLPNGNTSATLQVSDIFHSNEPYNLFNEGHIFKISQNDSIARMADDFIITSRRNIDELYGTFRLFNVDSNRNPTYWSEIQSYIGYAPIDNRIKRWIFFYHDYDEDIYKTKKYSFFFLAKRYELSGNQQGFVTLRRKGAGQLADYHNLFSNTDVFLEYEYLANIVKYLAFLSLGFKIFIFSESTTVNTVTGDVYRFKTYKHSNNKHDMDVYDYYYYTRYINADKSMYYFAKYLNDNINPDRVFFNYSDISSEVDCVNILEVIYNVYYDNRRFAVRRFNHEISMEEFGTILACGNMIAVAYLGLHIASRFIPKGLDNTDRYFLIPDSYFLQQVKMLYNVSASTSVSIAVENLKTSHGFMGGIVIFHKENKDGTFYPTLRATDIRELIEEITGEKDPIFLTNNRQEMDKRLYTSGIEPLVLYDKTRLRDMFRISRFMTTYTDRHNSVVEYIDKSLQIKHKPLKGIFVSNNLVGLKHLKTYKKIDTNTNLYYYYIYDENLNAYRKIDKIEDVIDIKMPKYPNFEDIYFKIINGTVDRVFFMHNIHKYVSENIRKITIPVIDMDHIIQDTNKSVNYFFEASLIAGGLIFEYPSLWEYIHNYNNANPSNPINTATALVRILLHNGIIKEYDEKTGLYYREFLYNKYLRYIMIKTNAELYRRTMEYIEGETDGRISLVNPDYTIEGLIEVKKLKELEQKERAIVSEVYPNIKPNDMIKVCRAELQYKTILSGIITETIVNIFV